MKPKIVEIDGTQWKLSRYVGKDEVDEHHLMGRMNRHKYNTNIEQNKIKISRRLHVALNGFFGDKQNPRDQLKQVFELVKPVLSRGVKQELEIILNCDDDLFYIPELLKGKKQKNGTKKATIEKGVDTD